MKTNTPEREAMRFVISGRSFDTATSAPVAIHRGVRVPDGFDSYNGAEQHRWEDTLYRTAKGAYWLHEHETVKYPKGKPVVMDKASEVDATMVVKWISDRGAAILDSSGFDLPEEA